MTRRTIQMLMIATLALAAACGDDDGDDTTAVDMFIPTGDAAPESNTIVDVAQANGSFTTLLAAAERVGLVGLLQSEGPFTVFAPTDDAFDALGVDLSTLTDEQLRGILSYHAITARVPSTEIPATAETAAGLTLLFDTTDGVRVNDANVIMADVEADNGIIHVIDRVLLPPDIVAMAGFAGLTELLTAVGAAAPIDADTTVADALSGDGPLTVFAPTDAAFEAAAGVTAGLSAEELRDVLLYHVVAGSVTSGMLSDGDVETLNGASVTVDTAGPTVNGAAVVLADVIVTNGVIHLVDEVLLPE